MRRVLPLALLASVALTACSRGCSPAEPDAAPAVEKSLACPAPPAWSPGARDDAHLLVELLYEPGGDRKTGMRVYDDGRVQTFDDLLFDFTDDKPKSRPGPNRWVDALPAPADDVAAIRSYLESADVGGLRDFQGKERREIKKKASFVTARKDGALVVGCFRSQQGSPEQSGLEKLVYATVGHVNDAAKKAAAAASSH